MWRCGDHLPTSAIVAVKLKMINQDRMIFGDFSVNFEPISPEILQRPFSNKILPGVKNSQKLYLIFQKLDNLACNKILKLV